MINRISKLPVVLSILIALFLLLAIFFTHVLHYNLMHSDVLTYWQESFNWRTPFYEHPPLYAFTIALSRNITFNVIDPVSLMMAINLVAFSVCVVCIYQISRNFGASQIFAALAAFLFGLWPFTGLTFTVMPIADSPAFALTLAGVLSLQKPRRLLAAILFSLAILTHKGVWPIIGLITLVDFLMRHEIFSKKNAAFVSIMLFPLVLLWVGGVFYHHSFNWLMERSMLVNTTLAGGYPILDGLFGSFQKGGFVGFLKGTVVLSLILLSIVCLILSVKNKFRGYEYCIGISVGVLIMFLFSSSYTIWGPVRYSKFLVVPLFLIMNKYYKEKPIKMAAAVVSLILFVGLFVTQLGFAWYLTIYHLDNL